MGKETETEFTLILLAIFHPSYFALAVPGFVTTGQAQHDVDLQKKKKRK